MSIFDWINSDDGPKFDDDLDTPHGSDDFAGVTRWNGKQKETGDRDDKSERNAEIERGISERRESQRNFDALYRLQLSETSKPKRDEIAAQELEQARQLNAERGMRDAIEEGQRRTSSPHRTPYGLAPSVYVEPAQRFDFTPVLIVAFIMLGIFVALGG